MGWYRHHALEIAQEEATQFLLQAVQWHPYEPPYDEVLADLKITGILDSMKPEYHHRLACALWDHSNHFG